MRACHAVPFPLPHSIRFDFPKNSPPISPQTRLNSTASNAVFPHTYGRPCPIQRPKVHQDSYGKFCTNNLYIVHLRTPIAIKVYLYTLLAWASSSHEPAAPLSSTAPPPSPLSPAAGSGARPQHHLHRHAMDAVSPSRSPLHNVELEARVPECRRSGS
jgi:hypothetical protein